MAKRKNNTTDSASKKVEAFNLAQSGLPKPPSVISLKNNELPYWYAIVSAKRADAWTDIDLIDAAKLAKDEARAVKLQARLSRTSLSKKDGSINEIYKQIDKELDRLNRLILAAKRHLQIHPRATQGESRDQSTRNQSAREVKQSLENMPDSLIAGTLQ